MDTVKIEQLNIEGYKDGVVINVYLNDFKKNTALKVLQQYIRKFRAKKLKILNVFFWDTQVAGDYISFVQNNNYKPDYTTPLKGVRYMKACFDFSRKVKSFFRTKVL